MRLSCARTRTHALAHAYACPRRASAPFPPSQRSISNVPFESLPYSVGSLHTADNALGCRWPQDLPADFMKSFVTTDSRQRAAAAAGRACVRAHARALCCRHYARFIEEQLEQQEAFLGALPSAGASEPGHFAEPAPVAVWACRNRADDHATGPAFWHRANAMCFSTRAASTLASSHAHAMSFASDGARRLAHPLRLSHRFALPFACAACAPLHTPSWTGRCPAAKSCLAAHGATHSRR